MLLKNNSPTIWGEISSTVESKRFVNIIDVKKDINFTKVDIVAGVWI